MALPVSPAPKSDDVAVTGWSGITVRVAWTLLACGVRIRPEVLDAARAHVILHLAPSTDLPKAEDRADHLTRRFVAQARNQVLADPWPADAEMPLTDRWARAVDVRDRTSQAVYRLHYGDHKSLAHVERKLGVDRVAVEAARAGLREVLRRVARDDGVPLDTWPADRLDRVLARLAAWAPDACPPMYDVVNGAHRAHVRVCTRCNRMARLVAAGQLEASDLQAPTLRARPRGDVSVLALHLHPDGRAHRGQLAAALPVPCVPVGDDLLLVEASDRDRIRDTLALAAEVGLPERQHLRGALLHGPGQWSTFGPLGPIGAQAVQEVRSRSWGVVDGMGALPEALPAPPSAWNAWGIVAGLAVAAAFAVWLASTGSPAHRSAAHVRFVDTDQGTWAAFDVPEPAQVHVLALQEGRVRPVFVSRSPADKATLATGDGSYRTRVPSADVLLVATDGGLSLDALIASPAVLGSAAPLSALAREILRIEPHAEVFLHGR